MRDIVHNVGVVTAIGPAVQTGQVTGSIVDLQGFESVAAIVQTGAVAGAGDFSVKLQHSDTTATGDFVDVGADALMGAFPGTLEADTVATVGYCGNKRYVRAVLTKATGTSIAAGVTFLKGHPHDAPVVA